MLKTENILAFDFGTKHIGVALGDLFTKNARPLVSVHRKNKSYDWQVIADLLKEWQPMALVVGRPLTLEGEEQEISRLAAKFANQLRGRFGLEVHEVDERLTSQQARDIIAETDPKRFGKRNQKERIDQMAAQIILQAWFDEH